MRKTNIEEIRIRRPNPKLIFALKREAKEKNRKSIHDLTRAILMERYNIQ